MVEFEDLGGDPLVRAVYRTEDARTATEELRAKLEAIKRHDPEVTGIARRRGRPLAETAYRGEFGKNKPRIQRVIYVYDDGSQVCEQNDGTIVCSCVEYQNKIFGQLQMCKHVQEVFEQEADALEALPGVVMVPVFRKPGVSMTVKLEPPNKIGMRAVIFPPAAEGESSGHLGFIQPGQGRKSLRTLLLDWAAGYDWGTLECTAIHHVGHPNLVNPTRDRIARLADICMYFMSGGACCQCVNTDGVPEL